MRKDGAGKGSGRGGYRRILSTIDWILSSSNAWLLWPSDVACFLVSFQLGFSFYGLFPLCFRRRLYLSLPYDISSLPARSGGIFSCRISHSSLILGIPALAMLMTWGCVLIPFSFSVLYGDISIRDSFFA